MTRPCVRVDLRAGDTLGSIVFVVAIGGYTIDRREDAVGSRERRSRLTLSRMLKPVFHGIGGTR